ncbi:MAG: histidinol phosphatase [Ruminococcaceae bacterium]|nr:histidinol phosphatase [Oscillospiraceae bacterium]
MGNYFYETHLHTAPVSKCGRVGVRENLEFYKSVGYDGVFITNHFIDGNIGCDRTLPYEDKIQYYCSDYEQALDIGEELDIRVFFGVEMSYKGTDFLVYGLDKAWYLSHPEIDGMKYTEKLSLLAEHGALIIQAHPYREASYIDHIRLFPRHVEGVEVDNACRNEFTNHMASHYADAYGLIRFAGTDNHVGASIGRLAGMCSDEQIADELDFIQKVRQGGMKPFTCLPNNDGRSEWKKLLRE